MLSRSLGLLATTAVAANAILLPPDVSTATSNIDSELAALGVVDPETQVVEIAIGDCVGRDGACSLVLNITTASPPKSLSINGREFYSPPPRDPSGLFSSPMMIPQVPSGASLSDFIMHPESVDSQLLRLSSSSFESGPMAFRGEGGEEIIPMSFQIYSVNEQAINAPLVSLKVLKGEEGDLMVLSINVEAPKPMDHPEDKICADWPFVCQWRDYLAGKAHAMKNGIKGCMGRKKGPHMKGHPKPHYKPHGRPHPEDEGLDFPMPDMPPHHGGGGFRHHGGPKPPHAPHHPHHHGHRPAHHSWFSATQILMMFISAILILMVSYAAGYVIGTVLGYAIVGVVFLVNRVRGTDSYHRLPVDEQDALAKEEAQVIVSQEQELPTDAPPAYDEKEVVV